MSIMTWRTWTDLERSNIIDDDRRHDMHIYITQLGPKYHSFLSTMSGVGVSDKFYFDRSYRDMTLKGQALFRMTNQAVFEIEHIFNCVTWT
jgi:hypothetical protein